MATTMASVRSMRSAFSRMSTSRRLYQNVNNVARLDRKRVSVALASSQSVKTVSYKTQIEGETGTESFRVFLTDDGSKKSPWHDVPLYCGSGDSVNFFCEIPKETDAKMECATDEKLNPIKQDMKKGKLRFYPYNINWNYGMLPQTWEDPKEKNDECGGVFGDNDPVDVVEIGSTQLEMGGMYPVKVLGAFAMIDDGELDWKIIAISEADPKASEVNDVDDVEKVFPGELEKIRVWFRDYKVPDGKPQNAYGFDDKCMPKDFTMNVISETHGYYKKLMSGERVNDEELSLE